MPKSRTKKQKGLPVGTRVKFRGVPARRSPERFSRIYGTVIQPASHTGALRGERSAEPNGGLRQKVRMERTGRVVAWQPAELIAVEGVDEKA